MLEDKFSLKANLKECFSYAYISNLGYTQEESHFHSLQM